MTDEEIKTAIKEYIADKADELAEVCIRCCREGNGNYDDFMEEIFSLGSHIPNIAEANMYPERYGGPDSWE